MREIFYIIISLFLAFIIFIHINWYAGKDIISYHPAIIADKENFDSSVNDDYKINDVLIQPAIKDSDSKYGNIVIEAFSKDKNAKILVNSVYGKDKNNNCIFSAIKQKNIELKYDHYNGVYRDDFETDYVVDFTVDPKKITEIEITINVTVSNGDTTITDEIDCVCEQYMYHDYLIPIPTV